MILPIFPVFGGVEHFPLPPGEIGGERMIVSDRVKGRGSIGAGVTPIVIKNRMKVKKCYKRVGGSESGKKCVRVE